MHTSRSPLIRSTTVVAIKHNGKVALGADGQATLGSAVIKEHVHKVRKLAGGRVLTGFAGSTGDALILLDKFSGHLRAHTNNMYRAVTSFAKEWRTDRQLRRLEALMLVADKDDIFILSGSGDVIRPDNDTAAIGSGGMYAYAAALALKEQAAHLSATEMVDKSLAIAAKICIYTNDHRVVEEVC